MARKRRKKNTKSKKGGAWEREMCGKLSMWFSRDCADDLFWRSAMSGGRATVRRRKGKRTSGHCGDIASTCKQGEKLTRVFAIELKRGYSKYTIADIFDRPESAAQQKLEDFIEQSIVAHENAGSYSWLLIHRRDRREAIVWMELKVERALKRHGAFKKRPHMRAFFNAVLRMKVGDNVRKRIVGIDWDSFVELVPPSAVIKLWKEWRCQ